MLINLDQEQVEYIEKFIKEHIQLTKEDIEESREQGYCVVDEIKDLKMLKGILEGLNCNTPHVKQA